MESSSPIAGWFSYYVLSYTGSDGWRVQGCKTYEDAKKEAGAIEGPACIVESVAVSFRTSQFVEYPRPTVLPTELPSHPALGTSPS